MQHHCLQSLPMRNNSNNFDLYSYLPRSEDITFTSKLIGFFWWQSVTSQIFYICDNYIHGKQDSLSSSFPPPPQWWVVYEGRWAGGAMHYRLALLSFPPCWYVLGEETSCHPVVSSCGATHFGKSRQSPLSRGKGPQRAAKASTCWVLIEFQSEVKRLGLAIYIGKGQKGLKSVRQLIKLEHSYILAKENRCGFSWTMYRINLGVLLKVMDAEHQHACQLSTGHCMDCSLVFSFPYEPNSLGLFCPHVLGNVTF